MYTLKLTKAPPLVDRYLSISLRCDIRLTINLTNGCMALPTAPKPSDILENSGLTSLKWSFNLVNGAKANDSCPKNVLKPAPIFFTVSPRYFKLALNTSMTALTKPITAINGVIPCVPILAARATNTNGLVSPINICVKLTKCLIKSTTYLTVLIIAFANLVVPLAITLSATAKPERIEPKKSDNALDTIPNTLDQSVNLFTVFSKLVPFVNKLNNVVNGVRINLIILKPIFNTPKNI